ncbi:Lipase 5 [Friedmanniomyces endolithicus]|nr:Lipase 5 [Friedmanniomyces endolithicus]
MELLTGTRWHGVRVRGEDEHEDGGRPSKRLRLSKSISVLQPVTRFVRSPLDTIGNLAESLGYIAHPPLSQHEEQKQVYLARLQTAETYDEWRTAALELDETEGGDVWKAEEESEIYNVALVRSRLQSLESARENRDFGRMRFLTRTSLTRDLGGMGNVCLYKHSRVGTKALIEHYIDTVVDTIEMVVEEAGAGVGLERGGLKDQSAVTRRQHALIPQPQTYLR